MPTKETKSKVEKIENTKKKTNKTTSTTKKAATKKVATKKSVSKTTKPKASTSTTKKKTTSTTKKTNSTAKKATKTTSAVKRNTANTTKTKKVTKQKAEKIIQILEYYDLPYRYNETIVKILAQTPNVLFVYWDISDEDRNNYINKYGQYFFNDTYPVLIVHNKTKNYTIEVPINDFANSWYLNISDANCEYNIELGRRFKEYVKNNTEISVPNNNYIHITNSNNLIMPNDHVLFQEMKPEIEYRNVKTGETHTKKVSDILLNNTLKPLSDFYELYKNIYQVEKIDSSFFDLKNPGSSNPSSTFK